MKLMMNNGAANSVAPSPRKNGEREQAAFAALVIAYDWNAL
jgi:hypothetical protein